MPAAAITDPAALCEAAAERAAAQSGVPVSVLDAISLTETGRRRGGTTRPWPWAVNMEGAGRWFDDEDAARAFVYAHFRRGARSFDVGCFQINYKWHHRGFASIEEMFDPDAGARYAAGFLRGLYDEFGSWDLAAGAYHSRTPDLAERYSARFARFRSALEARGPVARDQPSPVSPVAGLTPAPGPVAEAVAERASARVNGFPLLHGGARGTLGSLVPAAARSAQPLIALAAPGS